MGAEPGRARELTVGVDKVGLSDHRGLGLLGGSLLRRLWDRFAGSGSGSGCGNGLPGQRLGSRSRLNGDLGVLDGCHCDGWGAFVKDFFFFVEGRGQDAYADAMSMWGSVTVELVRTACRGSAHSFRCCSSGERPRMRSWSREEKREMDEESKSTKD